MWGVHIKLVIVSSTIAQWLAAAILTYNPLLAMSFARRLEISGRCPSPPSMLVLNVPPAWVHRGHTMAELDTAPKSMNGIHTLKRCLRLVVMTTELSQSNGITNRVLSC